MVRATVYYRVTKLNGVGSNMSENVIVALITGVLAVIGSYVGNLAISAKKAREEAIRDAEREQHQKDQLAMILDEQVKIKKRLDEHNSYAEKFVETKTAIVAIQKDIEYLKERSKNV